MCPAAAPRGLAGAVVELLRRSRPGDPFYDALRPVVESHGLGVVEMVGVRAAGPGATPCFMDREARAADIDATGAFGRVRHEMIHWTGRHSPRAIRALFASLSSCLDVAPNRLRPLLDEVESLATGTFGGVVERPYRTAVYLAQRRR